QRPGVVSAFGPHPDYWKAKKEPASHEDDAAPLWSGLREMKWPLQRHPPPSVAAAIVLRAASRGRSRHLRGLGTLVALAQSLSARPFHFLPYGTGKVTNSSPSNFETVTLPHRKRGQNRPGPSPDSPSPQGRGLG